LEEKKKASRKKREGKERESANGKKGRGKKKKNRVPPFAKRGRRGARERKGRRPRLGFFQARRKKNVWLPANQKTKKKIEGRKKSP